TSRYRGRAAAAAADSGRQGGRPALPRWRTRVQSRRGSEPPSFPCSLLLTSTLDRTHRTRIRPSAATARGALEPAGFVDEVAQRRAAEEAAAIVEDDLVAALVEIGAVAGGVRRQQHARGCP